MKSFFFLSEHLNLYIHRIGKKIFIVNIRIYTLKKLEISTKNDDSTEHERTSYWSLVMIYSLVMSSIKTLPNVVLRKHSSIYFTLIHRQPWRNPVFKHHLTEKKAEMGEKNPPGQGILDLQKSTWNRLIFHLKWTNPSPYFFFLEQMNAI